MKLEDLRPSPGARKESKRKGRGNASGNGTTAGRGYKGQKARSGGFHKTGFEGGQMPLQRRLPKFGFNNIFKKNYTAINLSIINTLPNDNDLNPDEFVKLGIVKKSEKNRIKILADGEINKPYNIKAHKFSKTATSKIQNSGGKAEVIV